MLFIKKLIDTRSNIIYAAVYDHLHNNGQIATDGASAMTGKHNGFVANLEVAPHIMTIYCIILREHLAAKSLNKKKSLNREHLAAKSLFENILLLNLSIGTWKRH